MTKSIQTIDEFDMDSLHILPLSILPLQTPSLLRARLIKNSRYVSVVEIFSGDDVGSGQIEISKLPEKFHWEEGEKHPDMVMMRKLGRLPSYDVFSLRIALREMGIDVKDVKALKISDQKNKELTSYMSVFTRPLINEIYGGEDVSIQSFEDVLNLFRSPDIKQAMEKLRQMANKLGIEPEEVPKFLEDFGDIFMSLSYYKQCLDAIEPHITEFMEVNGDFASSMSFKDDRSLTKALREVYMALNEAMAGLTGRFEAFDRASKSMWNNVSAEQFQKVEKLIKDSHATNGGVLCLLSVKMDAWAKRFPSPRSSSPGRRAEFIQMEMKHNIDKVLALEAEAPKISDLN